MLKKCQAAITFLNLKSLLNNFAYTLYSTATVCCTLLILFNAPMAVGFRYNLKFGYHIILKKKGAKKI